MRSTASTKNNPKLLHQVAQPAGTPESNITRVPRATTAVVWKWHPDNTMEPVKVSLGITDHAFTEITAVLKGEFERE